MKTKNKIILYAVVLLVAIASFGAIGIAGIEEKQLVRQNQVFECEQLTDFDAKLLLMRLTVFENTFYQTYKSSGCNRIYDVNRNGIINFQDAGLCWAYGNDPGNYTFHGDLLYDVNMDGQVNFQDAGLCYINRD